MVWNSIGRLAAACVVLMPLAWGCTRTVTRGSWEKLPRQSSVYDLPAEEFVYIGMDVASLTRLVGEPRQKESASGCEVWYYDFGVVILEDGVVRYKYPPPAKEAAAELPEEVAPNAESGAETNGY